MERSIVGAAEDNSERGMPHGGRSVAPLGEALRARRHHHPSLPELVEPKMFVKTCAGVVTTVLMSAVFAIALSALEKSYSGSKCESCLMAQKYMDRVMDGSVSPCDDFYQYVCGHWNHTGKPSFVDDVLEAGDITLVQALSAYPKRSEEQSWTFDMLLALYHSCLEEFGQNRNASYMAEKFMDVAGLSWDQLLRTQTIPAFLDVAILMSVKLDLDPIFSITFRRFGYAFTIHPNDSILDFTAVSSLLLVSKELINPPPTRTAVSGTYTLLQNIADVYKSYPAHVTKAADLYAKGSAPTVLLELDFGSPVLWVEAVERYSPKWANISISSDVVLLFPSLLRNILKVFKTAQFDVLSLYLCLHVVRAIVGLSYMSGDRAKALTTCKNEIKRHEFLAVRQQFLLYSLASASIVAKAQTMFADVILHSIRGISANPRLNKNDRSAMVHVLQPFSFRTIFSKPYPDLTNLTDTYRAFPVNLTVYHSRVRISTAYDLGNGADFLRDLSSCLSYPLLPLFNFTTDMCSSPYALQPPMYYPYADEATNFGSLGFVLASQVLYRVHKLMMVTGGTQLQAIASILTEFSYCQRAPIEGRSINEMSALSAINLGLRAAFDSYRSRFRVSFNIDRGAADRTFFRRACLLYCSAFPSATAPQGYYVNAQTSCNAAVRSMPEFFAAFRCPIGAKMSENGICTLF